MVPKTDSKAGDPTGYAYRPHSVEIPLDPMDAAQFKPPDSLHLYRGHSPTKPIRNALDTCMEAKVMNLRRLLNNGVLPFASGRQRNNPGIRTEV